MKNKIIKASLFSALTLSALIFVGGGLRNNDAVKCNNVSKIIAPATPKVSSSNIDWPTTGGTVDLTEDTELTSTWTITEGTTDLNLNGHVLSVLNNSSISIIGDAILNINDNGSNTHNYLVDSNHRWSLDPSGDKTITGGVIYNAAHSTTQPTFKVNYDSQLVINGGTICGSGYRAIQSSGNTTITMNGGSISGNSLSNDNGGAISLQCKTFTLNDGVISENYVNYGYGGAIYVNTGATAVIKGGLITKNVALNRGSMGGGAFSVKGTLIIDGGEISYNQAISTDTYSSYGGAAFLYINSTTIVNGGLITHNSSIAENGGTAFGAAFTATDIYDGASTLTINGGEFSYNESISNTGNARGGAIYCHAKTDLIINGGLITHNVAKVTSATANGIAYGGGIYANKYHIHGGEISYNEAQNCGAIYSNAYLEATPNCFEVPEGSELIIKNNIASVENGAGNVDSTNFNVSGKITIADNKVSTSNAVTNHNLLITKPVTVTGSLEGSNIHYVYNATGESEVVVYDYSEKTGSTRVNEFFHYEGDNHYYQDISADGDIVVKEVQGGGTTHPIETPTPSESGNVYADFDSTYPGNEVTVTVELTECHRLTSLIASYGSTQLDITSSKKFTMPDADVEIIANFVEHHELVLIKGKKPTATEAGWKDYYQCTECKKYYEDKEGTKEIVDLEAWKIGEGKIDPIGPGPAPEPSNNASTSTLAIVAFTVGGVSLLALLIIIIILLAKKKKKDEEKITNVRCDKKDSIAPKLNEYVFSFKYKGNEVKYFMFLTKTNRVSKDDVLKMFDRLKQNGEIIKYAKRFDKERERKKKILIPLFILLGVISIAGAAYGTYYAINNGGNKPIEEKVEISEELMNEGVALSNPTVKIGEKYETKITVDTTKSEGKVLPDKLEKVTCGNKDLDPLPPKNEYTYTLDADGKKADLVIPAEFVTGNITIKFSLVTPVPPGPTEYVVIIPSIEGLSISDDRAYPDKDYAPTITYDNSKNPGKELPDIDAVDITVGTTPLDETKGEFEYTLNEGHLTADLFIDKKFIKDKITITFSLADVKKTLEFNGAGCEAFIGKDTPFEEGEFIYGSKVDLTLKQKSIYSKPDTISFTTKSGEEYKGETFYDKGTGAISINSLTDDVVITAEAPALAYSTMHYEYSSNEGENIVSIAFTKAASAENVSVDWGNGAPVTYTESPAVSEELTASTDIKIYGAASIALYKGTQVLSEGNNKINSVTFGKDITTIDDSAFYGIPLTGELYLPENITTVKGYSFVNTKISSIHISSKCNISSQKSPFYCNTQLERISVSPENKSYYSENECLMQYNDNQPILFQGTKNSTIPNNTYKIADEAFHWIDVPEELVIPASVTEIGNSAFSAYFAGTTRQSKLKKVTFEDNSQLKSIGSSSLGSSFSSNKNLEAVLNVPNTLEKICDTSFSSCSKLSRFNGTEGVCDIPDSVKTISYRAFNDCDGFKVVIMPASLTNMGGGGQFISTYLTTVDLTKLTNPDAIPPITRDEGPFGNPTTIITASDEMTAAFQSAKGWKDHASKYFTQTGLKFTSNTYHLLYPSPAGLNAPYINNIVDAQGGHPNQSAITVLCGGEKHSFTYSESDGKISVSKLTGPVEIIIAE